MNGVHHFTWLLAPSVGKFHKHAAAKGDPAAAAAALSPSDFPPTRLSQLNESTDPSGQVGDHLSFYLYVLAYETAGASFYSHTTEAMFNHDQRGKKEAPHFKPGGFVNCAAAELCKHFFAPPPFFLDSQH